MAKFHDTLGGLDDFGVSITSAYDEDMLDATQASTDAVATITLQLAAKDAECEALKALNRQLLLAVPGDDGDTSGQENLPGPAASDAELPDADSVDITMDDLFEAVDPDTEKED